MSPALVPFGAGPTRRIQPQSGRSPSQMCSRGKPCGFWVAGGDRRKDAFMLFLRQPGPSRTMPDGTPRGRARIGQLLAHEELEPFDLRIVGRRGNSDVESIVISQPVPARRERRTHALDRLAHACNIGFTAPDRSQP